MAGAWRPYAVLIALLLGAWLITVVGGKVGNVSEAGIVMQLPDTVGGWVGWPAPVSEVERRGLPGDTEFERKFYRDATGNEVYCSIIMAGKDGRSIHRPETCLPAQGWEVLDGRYEDLPVNAHGVTSLPVRTLKIVRRARGQTLTESVERLNYYWFVGKDRVTSSHLQRIAWNGYDRIMHSVNHRWAYITVSAMVRRDDGAADAATNEDRTRAMVRGFIVQLFPQLRRQSPARTL